MNRPTKSDLFEAAFPASPASNWLRARVADTAKRTEPARRSRFAWRRWALGGALACAAAVAVFFYPATTAAAAYRAVCAQLADVKSAHLRYYLANGATTSETWYQAGRWRFEGEGGRRVEIWADGKVWTYRRDAASAEVCPNVNGPFSVGFGAFKVDAMLAEDKRIHHVRHLDLDHDVAVEGRRADKITLTDYGAAERTVLYADPKTDLPFRSILLAKKDGRWVSKEVVDATFDEPLDAVLFEPRFPAGTKIYDVVKGQAEWQSRLDKAELAAIPLSHGRLVVRDVQVAAGGDVFVLYTAGTQEDVYGNATWLDVHDDLGNGYGLCYGFMNVTHEGVFGSRPVGWWVDGEPVHGAWFTPTNDSGPWRPRTITLQAFLIGDRELSVKCGIFYRNGKPLSRTIMRMPGSRKTRLLTLRIERPTCLQAPEYAPCVGERPPTEDRVLPGLGLKAGPIATLSEGLGPSRSGLSCLSAVRGCGRAIWRKRGLRGARLPRPCRGVGGPRQDRGVSALQRAGTRRGRRQSRRRPREQNQGRSSLIRRRRDKRAAILLSPRLIVRNPLSRRSGRRDAGQQGRARRGSAGSELSATRRARVIVPCSPEARRIRAFEAAGEIKVGVLPTPSMTETDRASQRPTLEASLPHRDRCRPIICRPPNRPIARLPDCRPLSCPTASPFPPGRGSLRRIP